MPYKIEINNENREIFLNILEFYFEEGKSYEEISKILCKSKDYIYNLVKAFKPEYNIGKIITKYDYYVITGKIKNIIKEYNSGISSDKIGKKYGVSERTIVRYLKKEKVKIRDSGISSKTNQDIFENIDNEIKAYTLGLLMADGNVSTKKNLITITLTQDDSYLLEKINEELLDGNGNILISHKEDKKPRAVLQFHGKKIKKDLEKFNIVPRKSYNLLQLPTNIPTHLYHHFIRGLYDGDGVCSYYTSHKKQKVRIGYCAFNKKFVEDYRNFLNETINLRKNKLFNTGNCWQCSWASFKDLNNFFDYIYEDANIYLGRKYKKLKDFLNK